MIVSKGKQRIANTTFFQSRVPIKFDIKTGSVVIINTEGRATISNFHRIKFNPAIISGFNKNGINRIGLYIIGKPKITGSLILKQPGIKEAFDIALICSDFDFSPNRHNGSVFPVPPIIDTAPNRNTGWKTSGCPAAIRSALDIYAVIMGTISAVKITEVP